MRNAVIYCYHSLPANGTISKRQMFNSQTKFKKVSSKILLSVLSTHVLYVSVEGWEENTQRAKLIKYSTRCWTDDWQRTCFCLLSVLETYLSCSAIVIVRFYKQIPFWAICSIIFFLWTAFFPCCFSERFRDKTKTDVFHFDDLTATHLCCSRALTTLKQCHRPFVDSFLPQLRHYYLFLLWSKRFF